MASPYLQVSAALTLACIVFWSKSETRAADIAVGVLPNLLGFTVGALAIVLAFSSAEIFSLLSEEGEPTSFFLTLTANLVHFIFVQVLALTTAIMGKIIELRVLDILSLLLLLYAVLVTFSAALQLFQTARIYNARASILDRSKPKEQSSRPATPRPVRTLQARRKFGGL
ncbi:hypothetical protein [Bradyrhizobium elkanii]